MSRNAMAKRLRAIDVAFGPGDHRLTGEVHVVEKLSFDARLVARIIHRERGRVGHLVKTGKAALIVDLGAVSKIIAKALQVTDSHKRLHAGAAATHATCLPSGFDNGIDTSV